VGVELIWQGPSVALQFTRGPEGLSKLYRSVEIGWKEPSLRGGGSRQFYSAGESGRVERTESARWRQQTVQFRGALDGTLEALGHSKLSVTRSARTLDALGNTGTLGWSRSTQNTRWFEALGHSKLPVTRSTGLCLKHSMGALRRWGHSDGLKYSMEALERTRSGGSSYGLKCLFLFRILCHCPFRRSFDHPFILPQVFYFMLQPLNSSSERACYLQRSEFLKSARFSA
jgi:hypothetical protein